MQPLEPVEGVCVVADVVGMKEHLESEQLLKLGLRFFPSRQGNVDITKQAMEVGPTTHYVMGGVRVEADSQMSKIPGLFACGECAAGINGANRLGGNSLSDLLVLGKRAGEYAAKFAKERSAGTVDNGQVEETARVKTDFLNMAAHELRTPLTVVRGYLSLLREGSFGPV